MRKLILVLVMLSLLALGVIADGTNPDSSNTSSKFKPGDRVWTTTDVKVRSAPGLISTQIDSLAHGNSMIKGNTGTVLEGPKSADGYNWWNVSYDIGITGWSAENYLELAPNGPQQPDTFAQWSEDAIKWATDKDRIGSNDWNQLCLRFVSNAFMQKKAAGESGWTTATNAARELYRFNQETEGWHNALRGAVIFFDGKGSNEAGHVGIYLGPEYENGDYIVNAYGTVQNITIEDVSAKKDVGKYIGWSYPPEAWRPITQPNQDTVSTGSQPAYQIPQVTLTLYVHEGNQNGPIIPDAKVTGQDGSGKSFEKTTDSDGYATIDGSSGAWSFNASASGYATNSWSQLITNTCTKHAFLQKEQPQEYIRTNEYVDNSSATVCAPGSKSAKCPSPDSCVGCDGNCIPSGTDVGRGWSCNQGKWDYQPKFLSGGRR